MKRMLAVSMRFCNCSYLRGNYKGHLVNPVHETRRCVHEKAPKHSYAIGHRRRPLMTRGPVIRHMRSGQGQGKGHEGGDVFETLSREAIIGCLPPARATHFEGAAIDSCFAQLNPATNPATVAGIGPLLGPSASCAANIRKHRMAPTIRLNRIVRITGKCSGFHDTGERP